MSYCTTIRTMRPGDIDAVYDIDRKITGKGRREYYQNRLEATNLHDTQINASLVAESNSKVVGFLMGTLYFGEFGIPETTAVVDTLGVDPEFQDRGTGGALLDQFRMNMKAAHVDKIYTLVDWKEFGMLKFFGKQGFVPSQLLSLECKTF